MGDLLWSEKARRSGTCCVHRAIGTWCRRQGLVATTNAACCKGRRCFALGQVRHMQQRGILHQVASTSTCISRALPALPVSSALSMLVMAKPCLKPP